MRIYGTKKCPGTKKAERFFRDRGIPYQFVNLAEHPLAKGELENIRRGAGGESLVDTEGSACKKRGLAYMDYDETEELLANPLLLRTPLVREGLRVIVGIDETAWKALAAELKK
jgi:arsenate reductase-like glutaredoxin family protein